MIFSWTSRLNNFLNTEMPSVFLGLISVLPTLWGDFIFDDGEAIVTNEDVIGKTLQTGHPNGVMGLFWHDFWGSRINRSDSHKSYRPLTVLTYRLEYRIWGLNPFPFHFSNWLLHGMNCFLVYHFLRLSLRSLVLIRGQGLSYKSLKREKDVLFWASVIFACHPVHVEPLGGVVGRADLISAFIFMLGIILAIGSSWQDSELSPFILVTVIGIIGSLFKENTFVIVVFFLALKMLQRQKLRFSWKDYINYGITIMITVIFLLWRLWFQDGVPVFQDYDNPPVLAAPSRFSKIASVLYIWILNIVILINPVWSSFDWSMGCISLIETPSDIRFGLVVGFILVGLRLFLLAYKSRIIMLAVLIGIITFLPSSNLLFTVGFVIAERNLYLPSIGFSLLLSYSFLRVSKRKQYLVFVVVIFCIRSLQRSIEWTNSERLFSSALKVCPNNAKVHYNIGTTSGEAGNTEKAINSYLQAVKLKSDYYQAMNNLGNVFRTSNQVEQAEFWLRKAVDFKQDFAAAWMNLGIVLSKKNSTEAMTCYENALKYRKVYPDCEYNIGNLYLSLGMKELALKSWIRTISLQHSHVQAWINIVILLEKENRLQEARTYADKAQKAIGDADHTLQFLMGNVYGRLEEYAKAENFFQNAINICRNLQKEIPAKYWANLGVLYHRWGKTVDARECYLEALRIEPEMDSARKNLASLAKLRNRTLKI